MAFLVLQSSNLTWLAVAPLSPGIWLFGCHVSPKNCASVKQTLPKSREVWLFEPAFISYVFPMPDFMHSHRTAPLPTVQKPRLFAGLLSLLFSSQ